jgi:membrane protein DedA with SNARE-associated domain
MPLETMIAAYGYPVVFAGAVIEGETVVLLAALLVHQGILDIRGVLLSAALGAFAGDQCFFWIGRLCGGGFLDKRPRWQDKLTRATRLLDRYRSPVFLFYRFCYGLRAVIPWLMGSGRCKAGYFVLLSGISAVAWAAVTVTGGYLFGRLFMRIVESGLIVQKVLMGLLLAGLMIVWLHRLRS